MESKFVFSSMPSVCKVGSVSLCSNKFSLFVAAFLLQRGDAGIRSTQFGLYIMIEFIITNLHMKRLFLTFLTAEPEFYIYIFVYKLNFGYALTTWQQTCSSDACVCFFSYPSSQSPAN